MASQTGSYDFKAAKQAYIKASDAQTTANSAQTAASNAQTAADNAQEAIDNLKVGGRNLARHTAIEYSATVTGNYGNSTWSYMQSNNNGYFHENIPIENNEEYTLSFDYETTNMPSDAGIGIGSKQADRAYDADTWASIASFATYGGSVSSGHFIYHLTPKAFSPQKYFALRPVRYGATSASPSPTIKISNLKLEKGNMVTDWTPAPEDVEAGIDNALSRGVEYIVGTQTAQTNDWRGVTTDSTLETGKTIAYYLPYAGTSTPATLNLTLSTGIATGAKPVKINDTAVTTHYPAGAIIKLTFDGTSWKSDNYSVEDRLQLNNIVSSSSAIGAGRIVCSDSDGYKQIAAGVTFDISYPLLYSPDAIVANTETRNLFLTYPNANATTNGSIQGGASGKTLFLKGTLNEGMFTISSSPFLTTVAPTSVGYHYIPIGTMTSPQYLNFESQNKLYTFVIPEGSSTGSFQAVDAIGNLLAFDTIARLKTLEPIVNEHSTTLSTLEDKIVSKVEETFVAQDDFNSYFNTASSQITQDAKKLRLDFDAVEKLINGDGTDEGKGLRKEFDDFTKTVNKFFLFGNDGLTIGTDQSSLKLVLDNDLVGFYNGNTQIAYWDGATLHTGNVEVQTFKLGKTSDDSIGNYVATPRDDGSVVWNWKAKVSNGGD